MSGRSSADPDKLAEYSSAGLLRAEDLRLKGEALRGAIEMYNLSAGEHRSIDTAMADRVLAIAERWRYLDEFAGDVGRGFAELVARHQGPLHEGVLPDVVTFDDAAIVGLGQVGYASEDEAVEAAEQLADDMQEAIDSGDATTEQVEAMIAQAERGQHDPAFSVAFVTDMGVDGMVAIPALLDQAQPRGGHGNQPTDLGWVTENLAPFGALLTTAMSTRYDAQGNLLPDNQRNVDGMLSDAFVDEFVAYDGSDDERLAYSQLVEESALPADDLVRIGNHQLDEMLTGEETTPRALDANINILQALGANEDASFQWLRSDDIAGDGSGTRNMELVLQYQPAMDMNTRQWRPPDALGDSIAQIVDHGLQYGGPDNVQSDELFLIAVDTVTREGGEGATGEVHFDQLNVVLGEGAASHMDQLADSTTTPEDDPYDVWPDEDRAQDFLEVIMQDDAATTAVYRGTTEYIGDMTADAVEGNAPFNPKAMGGVVGLVTVADENVAGYASAERLAARQGLAQGVGLATNLVGVVPIGGDAAEVVGALRSLGSITANEAARLGINVPDPILAEELREIDGLRDHLRSDMDTAIARYHVATGTFDDDQMRDMATAAVEARLHAMPPGMDIEFWQSAPDGEGVVLKIYDPALTESEWQALPPEQRATVMTPDQAQAYRYWLSSSALGEHPPVAIDRTTADSSLTRVVNDHDA